MKLGFGKYSQYDVKDVPEEYLRWVLNNQDLTKKIVEQELARREALELAESSWMERIIKAGFRELAKRHHPDVGGTDSEMRELNAAFEALKEHL